MELLFFSFATNPKIDKIYIYLNMKNCLQKKDFIILVSIHFYFFRKA
jgi:hypothetical protein